MSRVSSGWIPNPSSSALVADRPEPNSTRPSLSRSSTATDSAVRMVLGCPEGVEAQLVAQLDLLHGVLVRPPLAALVPRPGDRDLVEQRAPHALTAAR